MSSITTSSSLGFDRGNGGGGKSKNYDWSVRFEKEHGWRNWFKRTLFSVNFHNELKTDFWSMRAIGKICQSTDAKENIFSVMAVWCIYILEKMMDLACQEFWSSKGETPIKYLRLTWTVLSPTICWTILERRLCAIMHDKVDAYIAGPNCRTRSVLRHYPKENAPRPIRAWNGADYDLSDLTPVE